MRDQGHNDVRMVISSEETLDSRRYNKLTAPEVAVIMPGVAWRGSSLHRHSVARSGGFSRINEIHPLIMLYIILFSLP